MKNNEEILWIFLHVPKCGGNTFRYHIENSSNKKGVIHIASDYSKFNKNRFGGHIPRTIEENLSYLSHEQKDKVKIIYGHNIHYGVHKLLNKKPRYVTIIRNPVSRIISIYNFFVTLYINRLKRNSGMMAMLEGINLEKSLLINKEIPSFEQWFEEKYSQRRFKSIFQFLQDLGYVEKETFCNRKINLSKFYFIGVTENYLEDSLFLYHKLGISSFFRRKNVSNKYFIPKVHERIKKLILSRNRLDQELYENALEMNKKFKRDNSDFYKIVGNMRIKRILTLPFHEFLQFSYKLSAKLKEQFNLYSKLVDYIKSTKCSRESFN